MECFFCFCGDINRAVILLIIYKYDLRLQENYFILHVIFLLNYTYKNNIVKPSEKLIHNKNKGGKYDDEKLCSLFLSIQSSIYAVGIPILVEIIAWLDIAGSRLSLLMEVCNETGQGKRARKAIRQLLKKYCLICQSTDLTRSLSWRNCYDFF